MVFKFSGRSKVDRIYGVKSKYADREQYANKGFVKQIN